MNEFQIPYGKSTQSFSIPDSISADWILPNPVKPAADPKSVIRSALDHPLKFDPAVLKNARQVAIAINDKTRPVPHHIILPPLLEWVEDHGVTPERIQFWIATGSHKPMTPNEYLNIVPSEVITGYKIDSHDIDDDSNLVHLGQTGRGTSVIVNRRFIEADVKILVGDIEPHHFAGFSGGYKTAAIGLAGRATINHNHSMITDPMAWIAEFDANPLRQDIEDIGRMIGVDLALNTILTTDKAVVAAFAGRPDVVMQQGIPVSREVCGTRCEKLYDIVLASAGGNPKDINFYQAQKALTHASLFARPGGTLILVAECPEGSGSSSYEEFMQGVSSVQGVFEKFSKMEFQVGPHKAFQVARLLSQYEIVMVSKISPATVNNLLMIPGRSVQEALQDAVNRQKKSCNLAILPYATTTIPYRLSATE